MVDLIAGQNIAISGDGAFCLALEVGQWRSGVIVTSVEGRHSLLDALEGVSLREGQLLLNLPDISGEVEKLTLYIASDTPGDTAAMSCVLQDLVGSAPIARVAISEQLEQQRALNVLEVYRRNGAWKLRCVMQGYNAGLEKLLASYELPMPMREDQPRPETSVRPAPSADSQDACISLRWESGKRSNRSISRYFVGENFKAISDLRIGCFYQLNNGQNGLVYSFDEGLFGSYDGVPYIVAHSDSNRHLEQLKINPLYRHKLDKYLIFVTMMEAYDSWDGLNVTVDFNLPGLDAQTISPQTLMVKPIYAVAMLDFSGADVKLTAVNEYFDDLTEMDRAFGWGLPWRHQNDTDNEDE
ncbi:MAG: TerD family protein [Pseudomonadales bacterium]